jgi:hypothetical protein
MAEILNQSTLVCPYFVLSDDGAETLEHEVDALELAHRNRQPLTFHLCTTCRNWTELCPNCHNLNRLLANRCRNCGQAMGNRHWPSREGMPDSSLGEQPIGLGESANLRPLPYKTSPSDPPNETKALLCQAGVIFQMRSHSSLAMWLSGTHLGEPAYPTAASINILSCVLLQGCAVLATTDKLWLVDLVDSLGCSHGSPNRKKSLSLKGQLVAPLAVDGHHLACLTKDEELYILQVFSYATGRLQLSWSQPIDNPSAQTIWLSVSGGELLLAFESGQLMVVSLESGAWAQTLVLPVSLAFLTPLARRLRETPVWLVAAQDGSIFSVHSNGKQLDVSPIASGCKESLFGFGANSEEIVCCHGKLIRRIDRLSGKQFELEVPQYCASSPWVSKNRAFVVSQEGTLYTLSLGSSTFQVEQALRLPGTYQGSTLAPVLSGNMLYLADASGQLVTLELK